MRKLALIFRYIVPYWKQALLNLFFNVMAALFGIFSLTMIVPFLQVLFGSAAKVTERPPLALDKKALLDNLSYLITDQMDARGAMSALFLLCLFVIVLFLLKNLFVYLGLYVLAPVRSGVVNDLRNEIYHKILHLPISYYSGKRKGDLIARITTDMQEVEWSIMRSFELFFREPVSILFFLITLIFLSPKLTLMVMVLLPLSAFLIGNIARNLRKSSLLIQNLMGSLLSTVEETIAGLRVIKAFNAFKTAGQKFSDQNERYRHLMVRFTRRGDLASPLSEFLGVLVMAVILWFGGNMVLNGTDNLSAEVFIAYVVIFSQLINPSKSFTTAYYQVQKGIASLSRINEILSATSNITDKPGALPIDELKDSIEFRNVCFSYEDREVLSDINFLLEKGQTIAIVGASGSGKTTLSNLLPRFYDITSGELLIDGIPVSDYQLAGLRSLFGIVSQDTMLFNDSIANNISFGMNIAGREDLEAAAATANATEFISKLEHGFDTVTGDRGVKLSGGQRQRISIARAILRNPSILILDEATSALDTASEKLVQDALAKIMSGRTSLIIAHRLSTVRSADLILVMENGRIVERGSYETLMQAEGKFFQLQQIQSKS